MKRVLVEEAAALLGQGWNYVDVRTEPEYQEGHPDGAFNVPFMRKGPVGMVPNDDFDAVVRATFGLEDKLIVGCRTGARSLRAAERLVELGFANIVDMRGGFMGERDFSGQVTCVGWVGADLPVCAEPRPERCYLALKSKL